MRAIHVSRFGTSDVLEVRSVPKPEVGPGEVRIAVHACGLNFAEILARQGLYPDGPKPPTVLGYEVAGVVDAVGDEVAEFREGDRVFALTRFGGHADAVCVPEVQCFRMPDGMSFAEASAIPVNYLTACHILFQVFRVHPGDHVLVHTAAGGVGTAALQLCRSVRDVTTYGTASAAKHAYVRRQGCDHAIDYRSEDYEEVIGGLNGGRGVELVMDALGASDWRKGYRLLRAGGMLVLFGWSSLNTGRGKRRLLHTLGELSKTPFYLPVQLMNDNKAVAGVNMARLWHEPQMIRAEMEQILALYRKGIVRPQVDKAFTFEQAAEAHRYLEQGKNLGKVVLIPDELPERPRVLERPGFPQLSPTRLMASSSPK